MTRGAKRPTSLVNYLKTVVLEAYQSAVGTDDVDDVENRETRIAEALEALLKSPSVRLRLSKAKAAGEREKAYKAMLLFYEELRELNAAPPSLLVPKNPPMHDATPEEIHALTTEAAATAVEAADEALRTTAKAINPDATPPTQQEIGDWIDECPPNALAQIEARIAALYGRDTASVRVTGWAYGGFTIWIEGERLIATAGELLADWKAAEESDEVLNPLAPLVRAWLNSRRIPTEPSRHPSTPSSQPSLSSPNSRRCSICQHRICRDRPRSERPHTCPAWNQKLHRHRPCCWPCSTPQAARA